MVQSNPDITEGKAAFQQKHSSGASEDPCTGNVCASGAFKPSCSLFDDTDDLEGSCSHGAESAESAHGGVNTPFPRRRWIIFISFSLCLFNTHHGCSDWPAGPLLTNALEQLKTLLLPRQQWHQLWKGDLPQQEVASRKPLAGQWVWQH